MKTLKYRNLPTVYNGRRYASKAEAEFARQLDLQMHAQGKDKVESWEPQVRFPIFVEEQKVCDYIVDFDVRYADGRRELVEVKSPATKTPLFKLKLKLFQLTFLNYRDDIKYTIHE